MYVLYRTIFFSNTLRKRLAGLRRASMHDVSSQQIRKKVDPKKLIDFSNTSVKEFLNYGKITLLKKYSQENSDRGCTYNFVIDERVAMDIAKQIMTGKGSQKKGIIVEGNAGLGLITINLIKSGVSDIVIFDYSKLVELCLTQLIIAHSEKVVLKFGNIFKNPDLFLQEMLDLGSNDVPVTIVGVATNFSFFKSLVRNFIKYQIWQRQFTVFMVLSNRVFHAVKENGATNIAAFKFYIQCIFNLLFELKEVTKYPRKAFLPQTKDTKDMHLVRLSLKADPFKYIKKEDLEEYSIFLKILARRQHDFVIPIMERMLPNCGPFLISKGVSMSTQICDLSRDDALLLYYFLKDCENLLDMRASICPLW